MRITVEYFALFREQTGTASETLDVDAKTPEALLALIRERHPALAPHRNMKIAVNDVIVDWQRSLADGDTVLLFPPVSGG